MAGLTATWLGVNIAFPLVLPPASMWLAGKFIARTSVEKRNAKVIRTVQEGQMGWIAIAWCALGFYEGWSALEDNHALFKFVALTSVGMAFVIFGAVFVSVGGSLNASDSEEDKLKYTVGSIILTVAAGFLFTLVHAKV